MGKFSLRKFAFLLDSGYNKVSLLSRRRVMQNQLTTEKITKRLGELEILEKHEKDTLEKLLKKLELSNILENKEKEKLEILQQQQREKRKNKLEKKPQKKITTAQKVVQLWLLSTMLLTGLKTWESEIKKMENPEIKKELFWETKEIFVSDQSKNKKIIIEKENKKPEIKIEIPKKKEVIKTPNIIKKEVPVQTNNDIVKNIPSADAPEEIHSGHITLEVQRIQWNISEYSVYPSGYSIKRKDENYDENELGYNRIQTINFIVNENGINIGTIQFDRMGNLINKEITYNGKAYSLSQNGTQIQIMEQFITSK